MPHRGLFVEEAAFEPETVAAMTAAYDEVIRALNLVNREDPLTEMVARKLVEIARLGEHDADRLATLLLTEFKPVR
jgi:hypothetical protein